MLHAVVSVGSGGWMFRPCTIRTPHLVSDQQPHVRNGRGTSFINKLASPPASKVAGPWCVGTSLVGATSQELRDTIKVGLPPPLLLAQS